MSRVHEGHQPSQEEAERRMTLTQRELSEKRPDLEIERLKKEYDELARKLNIRGNIIGGGMLGNVQGELNGHRVYFGEDGHTVVDGIHFRSRDDIREGRAIFEKLDTLGMKGYRIQELQRELKFKKDEANREIKEEGYPSDEAVPSEGFFDKYSGAKEFIEELLGKGQ